MTGDIDIFLGEILSSPEVEEDVIGCVLIDPNVFSELHFLKPEAFRDARRRWIWEAVACLYRNGDPVDIVSVSDALDRSGLLAEVGGTAYLTALAGRTPATWNAVKYGRILDDLFVRRRIIEAAERIANIAKNREDDLDTVIGNSLASLYAAADRVGVKEVSVHDALSRAYDQSVQAASDSGVTGILTGFPELDGLLGGLKRSKLYYVGGRPGRGKSALVLDMALSAASQGKAVRIFSQEMDAVELAIRVAAKKLGIDSKKIEEGDLDKDQWEAYLRLLEETRDLPIFIDETVPLKPMTLQAICQNEVMRGRLDLVIVDYVQLMDGEGATLRERITDVSRSLKRLSRSLSVPVVAAAQLSRNAEEGKPKMSDLQETGALEQDADVVMLLNRDDQIHGVVNVIIDKHRGGPTGKIDLLFKASLTRFESVSTRRVSFPYSGFPESIPEYGGGR